MTELFDVPESLSPYDRWLKRHRIVTMRLDGVASNAADGAYPWSAWQGECIANEARQGFGDTEQQAIADLCRKRNIPLYGAEELNKRKGQDDGSN